MRLITHNMLQCHAHGCNTNNFPLQLENVVLDKCEAEYYQEFLIHFIPRLDWSALYSASRELGITSLPDRLPDDLNEDFLKVLHQVLLEVKIVEGQLRCRNCNHVYNVSGGIPNMLLKETEI